MQDLIVKIDGEIVKIDAELVLYSRNPKTLEFGINICYREDSEKEGKIKADIDRYRFSVRIGMRRKQRKHWRKVYVIMK